MIKYILKCEKKHEFESWFLNSKEYEKLLKKKLIECIYCKSKNINKSIMAPKIIKSKPNRNETELSKKELKNIKKDLIRIRSFVEKNFEYVGENFSKKVKDIYYDKEKKKNIYGTATQEQKKELEEEGIELATIPWIEKDN